MNNTLLITGSKGTIGNIITPYLKDKSYNIIELDKNNPENQVDLSKDDIYGYFDGIKTVIHLAANPNPFIDKKEAEKNIELTKRIINACANTNTIERIINASSINVYAYIDFFERGEKIISDTKLSPNKRFGNGEYAKAKIKSEKILTEFCKQERISLINLRLGCVTKDNLINKQEDGSINPVDYVTSLKHNDLIAIISNALNQRGIKNYVCISGGNLFDKKLLYPLK